MGLSQRLAGRCSAPLTVALRAAGVTPAVIRGVARDLVRRYNLAHDLGDTVRVLGAAARRRHADPDAAAIADLLQASPQWMAAVAADESIESLLDRAGDCPVKALRVLCPHSPRQQGGQQGQPQQQQLAVDQEGEEEEEEEDQGGWWDGDLLDDDDWVAGTATHLALRAVADVAVAGAGAGAGPSSGGPSQSQQQLLGQLDQLLAAACRCVKQGEEPVLALALAGQGRLLDALEGRSRGALRRLLGMACEAGHEQVAVAMVEQRPLELELQPLTQGQQQSVGTFNRWPDLPLELRAAVASHAGMRVIIEALAPCTDAREQLQQQQPAAGGPAAAVGPAALRSRDGIRLLRAVLSDPQLLSRALLVDAAQRARERLAAAGLAGLVDIPSSYSYSLGPVEVLRRLVEPVAHQVVRTAAVTRAAATAPTTVMPAVTAAAVAATAVATPAATTAAAAAARTEATAAPDSAAAQDALAGAAGAGAATAVPAAAAAAAVMPAAVVKSPLASSSPPTPSTAAAMRAAGVTPAVIRGVARDLVEGFDLEDDPFHDALKALGAAVRRRHVDPDAAAIADLLQASPQWMAAVAADESIGSLLHRAGDCPVKALRMLCPHSPRQQGGQQGQQQQQQLAVDQEEEGEEEEEDQGGWWDGDLLDDDDWVAGTATHLALRAVADVAVAGAGAGAGPSSGGPSQSQQQLLGQLDQLLAAACRCVKQGEEPVLALALAGQGRLLDALEGRSRGALRRLLGVACEAGHEQVAMAMVEQRPLELELLRWLGDCPSPDSDSGSDPDEPAEQGAPHEVVWDDLRVCRLAAWVAEWLLRRSHPAAAGAAAATRLVDALMEASIEGARQAMGDERSRQGSDGSYADVRDAVWSAAGHGQDAMLLTLLQHSALRALMCERGVGGLGKALKMACKAAWTGTGGGACVRLLLNGDGIMRAVLADARDSALLAFQHACGKGCEAASKYEMTEATLHSGCEDTLAALLAHGALMATLVAHAPPEQLGEGLVAACESGQPRLVGMLLAHPRYRECVLSHAAASSLGRALEAACVERQGGCVRALLGDGGVTAALAAHAPGSVAAAFPAAATAAVSEGGNHDALAAMLGSSHIVECVVALTFYECCGLLVGACEHNRSDIVRQLLGQQAIVRALVEGGVDAAVLAFQEACRGNEQALAAVLECAPLLAAMAAQAPLGLARGLVAACAWRSPTGALVVRRLLGCGALMAAITQEERCARQLVEALRRASAVSAAVVAALVAHGGFVSAVRGCHLPAELAHLLVLVDG
ncbi:hypothetical protein HYH02_004181 [Chlamydomonas schloesseri]|uniref:Uncharacterized protein n=1 Tax=Chlamydomonas schloesseri TaxID=2026947 RepID=A0A835WQ59_9CHLO|nr:hypothetical protein HYH02_004181 [Chlamydomonas schloesseri]|eukprot:KAG2451586.1 hypothetical protein HYH02_004181 [Chlamydomonas schloesseri]